MVYLTIYVILNAYDQTVAITKVYEYAASLLDYPGLRMETWQIHMETWNDIERLIHG